MRNEVSKGRTAAMKLATADRHRPKDQKEQPTRRERQEGSGYKGRRESDLLAIILYQKFSCPIFPLVSLHFSYPVGWA